jgi:hypothetical protein
MNLRKKIATVAILAGVAAASSTAVAFWTSSGSGTGTASTTAGAVGTLTFTTSSIDAMFPGAAAQSETVTLTNTGDQSVYIANVSAYVTTDKVGCTGADFLLQGQNTSSASPVALTWAAEDLDKNETKDASFTVQFDNNEVNQDACKGAVVTLNYAAS